MIPGTTRALRLMFMCNSNNDYYFKIDIDVSTLDIGQSVHIGDISFPPGLKSMEDENITIATVVAPTPTIEEEEVEEEVEEAESEGIKGEDKS